MPPKTSAWCSMTLWASQNVIGPYRDGACRRGARTSRCEPSRGPSPRRSGALNGRATATFPCRCRRHQADVRPACAIRPATITASTLARSALHDDGGDRVMHGLHVDLTRIDRDDVGLLAGRQAADPVEQAEHLGAFHGDPGERLAGGDGRSLRNMAALAAAFRIVEGTLHPEGRARGGEQVTGADRLEVDAQRGSHTPRRRRRPTIGKPCPCVISPFGRQRERHAERSTRRASRASPRSLPWMTLTHGPSRSASSSASQPHLTPSRDAASLMHRTDQAELAGEPEVGQGDLQRRIVRPPAKRGRG